MENAVAVMSIIVENVEAVDKLNTLLHDYREYIIGRMGLPYRPRNISIIPATISDRKIPAGYPAGICYRVKRLALNNSLSCYAYRQAIIEITLHFLFGKYR